MKQSMDSVILKKKENKKKWNDAYRKRIKEKTCSVTNKRRSILEKQRKETITGRIEVLLEKDRKKAMN